MVTPMQQIFENPVALYSSQHNKDNEINQSINQAFISGSKAHKTHTKNKEERRAHARAHTHAHAQLQTTNLY